jgi:hypothetical protein
MFLRRCVSYGLIKKKSSHINSNNKNNNNNNGKCESKSMFSRKCKVDVESDGCFTASHYPKRGVLPNGSTACQPPPGPAPEGQEGHQEEEEGKDGFIHQDVGKTVIATIYV